MGPNHFKGQLINTRDHFANIRIAIMNRYPV
jgi:hypothetical protein